MSPASGSGGESPSEIDEAGVDRSQIRAMLSLSPEERLRLVEEFVDSVIETREANETGPPR